MKKYYHATSIENARKIEKEGFRLGKDGMFGGGIYFSENPIGATKKARVNKCDSIIIANLDVGRLMTEEMAHNNWNLQILNSFGYDSVQMTHCRTGVEICLYEPSRIKIIGLIHWNQYNIVFKNIHDLNNQFDLNEYKHLIKDRKVSFDQLDGNSLNYHKISKEEIKQNELNSLDDIEISMHEREKMFYSAHSNWSNYEIPRLNILKDYLDMQNTLRQNYPDLKSKLDQRINNFLTHLYDERKQINKEIEFSNSLMRGIGSVSSLSSAPRMISELENYKKQRNII